MAKWVSEDEGHSLGFLINGDLREGFWVWVVVLIQVWIADDLED